MNENENKQPDETVEPLEETAVEPVESVKIVEAVERVETAEDTEGLDGEAIQDQAEVVSEPASKAAPPWPWIAIAALAVAALIIVLVFGNGMTTGGGNEVLGRVSGAVVTKADMYDEMAAQMPEGQAASALDNLLFKEIIGLEAKKVKAVVDEADMTAELNKYKQDMTDEQFNGVLQQNQMTLETLKEQISISIKIRQIFEPIIKPTEAQLQKHYDENKASFGTPEEVRASHILLETKEEAEAVLAELKKGADFAALTKEKSIDPGSKDNGGDLNFFGHGVMNEEFETAAFKLNKDELSGVVESPEGFHIIKVTDKKEAVIPAYETVKKQVKNAYLDEQTGTRFSEWYENTKKTYNYKNLLVTPTDADATAPVGSSPAVNP